MKQLDKHIQYKERVKNGEWSPQEAILKMEMSFLERNISKEEMYKTKTYKWLVRKLKNGT